MTVKLLESLITINLVYAYISSLSWWTMYNLHVFGVVLVGVGADVSTIPDAKRIDNISLYTT